MQKTMIPRVALVLLLSLAACATPYEMNGLTIAAREKKLNQNTYLITAKGNAYSSDQRIDDYTMLRAAEVAIENNYRFFSVKPQRYSDSKWDMTQRGVQMPTPTKEIKIALYHTEGETNEPLFDAAAIRARLGAEYIKTPQ